MEPLQLGTLSPSFLEQRAPEAPQLLGILSPTPPHAHPKAPCSGPHTSPHLSRGWGEEAPAHLPIPQGHPGSWLCPKTRSTLPSLPQEGGHSEESYPNPSPGKRLPEGEDGRKQKPGAWVG